MAVDSGPGPRFNKRFVLGPPVQVAYAVVDVYAAAVEWAERFGAGPFFVRPHIPLTEVVYRGRPSTFDHSSAYGQWGSVMVELVQDHGTAASVVRERYAPDQSGLHHLAHLVPDLDEAIAGLEAQGFSLAMTATSSATRFVFVDAVARLGHMIELYQPTDRVSSFYEFVARAGRDWDGTNPVRSAA